MPPTKVQAGSSPRPSARAKALFHRRLASSLAAATTIVGGAPAAISASVTRHKGSTTLPAFQIIPAKRLEPRPCRTGIGLLSQVQRDRRRRGDPPPLQEMGSLLGSESKAQVTLDPRRLQRVAGDEVTGFALQ